MDQLYFEDGYYEGKYFVYTADVLVGFTPYIDAGYLNSDFFEDRGGAFSLVGDITRQAFQQGAGAFTSAFTTTASVGRLQSVTVSLSSAFAISATVRKTARADSALTSSITVATVSRKTARSSITLTSIANVDAQAARTRLLTSSVSVTALVSATVIKTTQTASTLESQSTFTALEQRFRSTPATLFSVAEQTSNTQKTARAQAVWTSAFAPTITANASVDPGSDVTATFTVTALTGVIKPFSNTIVYGAQFTNDNDWLIYTDNSTLPYGVGAGQIISFWMRKDQYDNFGYIWNSYLDRSFPPGDKLLVYYVDKQLVFSSFTLTAPNSGVEFNFDNAIDDDNDWHHYAIVIRNWSGAFPGNFRANLYRDGVLITNDYNTGPGTYGHYSNWYRDNRIGYESKISLAQLWVGPLYSGSQTDEQVLALLENFYRNGYVNLGTGVVNGYTPGIYEPFQSPFSNKITSNEVDLSTFRGDLPLSGIFGRFTLTGESVTVLEITANAESASTLTATSLRTRLVSVALNTTATVNAVGSKTVGISSALSSTLSTTLISQRVRYAEAALASALTVTATAFRIKQLVSALNSTATQTATADNRTRIQSATLTSQFTISATIDNRNRDAIALQMGAFSLNVDYLVVRAVGSAMTSQFTQTATAQKVIVNTATLSSQFTFGSTVFRVLIAQANLQVNGFTLTQGDILNFDPCREIKAEQETRSTKILPENRLVIVDQETRMLRVPQETRVLKVDFETRVNIIKC